MRLPLIAALILVAAASDAGAQGFGVGGLLPFNEKCASCHVDPAPGTRAPTRAQLLGQPPGLDQILGGGLPEFSFNVIAGAPGAGKTTLTQQIMFALATPERPALYFTVIGEPPLKMLRYQQQFSFFDAARVGESVRYINLSEDVVNGTLEKLLARIVEEVEATSPGVVIVDSLACIPSASPATACRCSRA